MIDLLGLRPDAVVDDGFLVVGEVHERGEVLPEADRVDDGEVDLAGWQGRQKAQREVVETGDGGRAIPAVGLDQQRALVREGEVERRREALAVLEFGHLEPA